MSSSRQNRRPRGRDRATVRKGWVRSECSAHGATTSCISPGTSRVVTSISAGPRVFLMGKIHRWAPPTTPSNTNICFC